MSQYLMGIDNGSTVSKAALFDLTGKEVAVASCKAETEYPHPGWTERGHGDVVAEHSHSHTRGISQVRR